MPIVAPIGVVLALVLVALALLAFIYTTHKRIPTLGCGIFALLIVVAVVALLGLR